MGIALITIKIMPESPEVDLKEMQDKVREIITKSDGKNPIMKIEPIAFGLSAVMVNFSLDESKEIDPIENALKGIKGVSSTEITDFRRAFG